MVACTFAAIYEHNWQSDAQVVPYAGASLYQLPSRDSMRLQSSVFIVLLDFTLRNSRIPQVPLAPFTERKRVDRGLYRTIHTP